MSVTFARTCGAVLAYGLATQTAWADLSANDVWSDWRAYLASVGYEITGDESTSGDTLTIRNFVANMDIPEEEGSVRFEAEELTLAGKADGTVSITFPDRMPLLIDLEVEEGELITVEVGYSHSGAALTASGSPDDITYDYSASEIAVSLDSVTAEGTPVPSDLAHLNVRIANVATTTQMKLGEMRDYNQTMSADAVTYDAKFGNPETDARIEANGKIDGLAFSGTGMIPINLDPSKVDELFSSGFSFDGAFTYAGGSSALQGTGNGEEFGYNSTSTGGKLGVSMDNGHLGYDVSQSGVAISATSNELPFPVDMAAAAMGFKLDMPTAKSEEPQDFSLAVNVSDFTMSDMIWGIFDPSQALPRDPASVLLDLSGKATVLFDLMNPADAAMMEDSGANPGELNALSINNLLVSLVGATLTGTGDFTFDNSDLTSFDGVPAPTGVANLKLAGANSLIDKLIGMGMMSDSDAMGARMMMGMLGVPGEEPDTLTSKIEITGDGQILANGQRIK
ncbi:DUF2125 domain-containing protein [Primorskyibacter sp. S87]|uniref:DUF2125 domain-containing protein n=1 Tax=Primorskyibacter sp. S87 TaxID=3415126 RepID=UPI003C7AD7AA